MKTLEEKIQKYQDELASIKKTLDLYRDMFNADGEINSEEQKQLDVMQAVIKKIEAKLAKKLQRSAKKADRAEKKADRKAKKGEEQEADNESANPVARKKHKDTYVYKDVTEQQFNKITELYQKGKAGTVDENQDVHYNDVKQGALGDCYFLSAIGAVAKANPALLKKLIKGPLKDGSYEVTLHIKEDRFFDFMEDRTPHKVIVTPEFLVDSSGNPLYAKGGDSELWVMLLEKAFAILRGEERTDKKKKFGEGYDVLTGGWGEEGMEVLTGKEADTLWIKDMSDEEIEKTITSALKDKRPITTGTIPGPDEGKKATKKQVAAGGLNIVLGHEYFVIEYKSGKLKLRNPHNSDSKGGREITLELADYKKYYRNICVQQK